MKPALFLRIAAVLTFVESIGHTVGGVFGKPEPGPASTAIAAMQSNQFPILGFSRNYWDFYLGFGLSISVMLVAEAVILWQLASLAGKSRIRVIVAVFLGEYLGLAVLSWKYFFWPPLITDVLIAIALAVAFVALGSAERATR